MHKKEFGLLSLPVIVAALVSLSMYSTCCFSASFANPACGNSVYPTMPSYPKENCY